MLQGTLTQWHFAVYISYHVMLIIYAATTLRFNWLLFQWHWNMQTPIIIYAAWTLNQWHFVVYISYHVMLIIYATTTLRFNWLKSWRCNELSHNEMSRNELAWQRDVAQRVVAATSSRCNELSRNELSATTCRATSWSQRVVMYPLLPMSEHPKHHSYIGSPGIIQGLPHYPVLPTSE